MWWSKPNNLNKYLHKDELRKIINIYVKGKGYKTISKQLCIPQPTAELKNDKVYKIVANHCVCGCKRKCNPR